MKPVTRSLYLGVVVGALIVLSIIALVIPCKFCSCGSKKLETFCGCATGSTELFTTSIYCPERLVYNGRNYELWRDNVITHVFRTIEEYRAYWNFAYGSSMKKGMVPCALLNPMPKTDADGVIGENGQGSIVATQFIQEPRFYNIEHFLSDNGSTIEPFSSDDSARDIPIDSASLMTLTEANQRDEYLRKSQEIMGTYMLKNKECYSRIQSRDESFYRLFKESYASYIRYQFLRRLGYVPERPQLRDLNIEEAAMYVSILTTLPDCKSLILNYSSQPSHASEEQEEPSANDDVQPLESGSPELLKSGKRVLVEIDASEIRPLSSYWKEATSTVKGLFSSDVPKTTVADNMLLTKPSVSVESRKSHDVFGSLYSKKKSTEVIAPSDLRESSIRPEFRAPQLSEEVTDARLTRLSKGRMQSVGSEDIDMEYTDGPDTTPGPASQHIASNFPYTPDSEKPVKEMPRKIATTYGWSFIPQQFWSVPQKRPPICLPETGKVSNVVPIYDKSVPLDVLEWTQVKYETESDIEDRPVDKSFLQSHYAPGLYMTPDQHTRDE